ncbi:ERF family protein [Calothrix sp. NIES-4101]|nr:ERF family protein [Calothrix sp. NIES-4101]
MQTPLLNSAIAKAKLEFPAILANRTVKIPTKSGKQIEFTYAELEEIVEAVTPALSTNGLCLTSQIKYLENGKLVLATSLRHESGEFIESCYPLPDIVGDPKELGSQISYGRRYNSICLLEITTIEPSNPQQWDEKKRKLAVDFQKEVKKVGLNEASESSELKVATSPNQSRYPQSDRVKAICGLLDYPQELAREWLNNSGRKQFDEFPLEQIDAYVAELCKIWAVRAGMNEFHARNSYKKRVLGDVMDGKGELHAIRLWMQHVAQSVIDSKAEAKSV